MDLATRDAELAARVRERLAQLSDVRGDVSLPKPASFGPLDESPADLEAVLDHLHEDILPRRLETTKPGFMAYIPGGNLPTARVADAIAHATNAYVPVHEVAQGPASIEHEVVSWFADWCGLPDGAHGVLTTGGSMATFTALVAARTRHAPEAPHLATLYIAEDAHHSVVKSALAAGILSAHIRKVPVDERRRMDVDALRAAIAADRAEGKVPFMVMATAGTTNTGAVDDLPAIADAANDAGIWYHVDAAYGGFFMLTDEGRATLTGIERADSITLDPHKGLGLPFGTGALVVRDPAHLIAAFGVRGEYMPGRADQVDFDEMGVELSRDWRGLRVWLPLRLHGLAAFRAHLQQRLDWIHDVHAALAAMDGIEVVTRPSLSILTFRAVPHDGEAPADTDRRTLAMMDAINQGPVFLSGTRIQGKDVIRVCILGLETDAASIQALLDAVPAALATTS